MNHDEKNHQNHSGQPHVPATELEARIVASVTGEAAPFETAELERIAAEQPAVAEFKQQMESAHALLVDATRPDPQPLRLSPDRRAKLLKAIGASEPASTPTVIPMSSGRHRIWRMQHWIVTAAACAAVGVFMLIETGLLPLDKTPTRPSPAETILGPSANSPLLVRESVVRSAEPVDMREAEAEMKRRGGRKLEEAQAVFALAPAPLQLSIPTMPAQMLDREVGAKAEADPPAKEIAPRDQNDRLSRYAAYDVSPGLLPHGAVSYGSPAPMAPPPAEKDVANGTFLPTPQKPTNFQFGAAGAVALSAAADNTLPAPFTFADSAGTDRDTSVHSFGSPAQNITATEDAKLTIGKFYPPTTARFGSVLEESAPAPTAPASDVVVLSPFSIQAAGDGSALGGKKEAGNNAQSEARSIKLADLSVSGDIVDTGLAGVRRNASATKSDAEKNAFSFVIPLGAGAPNTITAANGNVIIDDPRADGLTTGGIAFNAIPLKDSETKAAAQAIAGNFVTPNGADLSITDVNNINLGNSTIGTSIVANGRTFVLANGNITIGGGAQINTQGLFLSTLQEPDNFDFSALGGAAKTETTGANAKTKNDPAPAARPAPPPPVILETATSAQPVSTFSLHVSDVSWRLAQAALARGTMPDAATVRPEEFYNAFNYGDPTPTPAEKVGCRLEQSAHPFLAQRNLLRIALKVAATGRGASTPLRLTVLLDTSGSMEREDRAATVQRAMSVLVSLLGPNDRLTLIGFARQPRLLAENVAGDHARDVLDILARTPPDGGTNLEAALQLADQLAMRHHDAAAQNRIILLTDGAANLGNAEPAQLAVAIDQLRQRGIAFDACGVGLDGLDDGILETLTRKGDGRYYVLNSPDDADAGFAQKLAGALRPAAENVKVQVRFNPARVATYRLIGFDQHRLREEDFRNDKVDAAELAAEEAGVALYQFEPLPQGEGDVGDVFVRFRDPATGEMVERSWSIPFDAGAAAFDRASPSLQLASVAALLAEKLRGDAWAAQIRLRDLATVVSALQGRYRDDPRVQGLVTMFAQARRLTGE